jgi:hypothetical protein
MEMAVNTLATIAQKGKKESARIAAASALLDRGFGKPATSMEVKGSLNGTLSPFIINLYGKPMPERDEPQ